MDKYQAAYAKRLEKLKGNRSPKAIARISAWDAFFNKEYEMQDLESQMTDSARKHYEQSDVKMKSALVHSNARSIKNRS